MQASITKRKVLPGRVGILLQGSCLQQAPPPQSGFDEGRAGGVWSGGTPPIQSVVTDFRPDTKRWTEKICLPNHRKCQFGYFGRKFVKYRFFWCEVLKENFDWSEKLPGSALKGEPFKLWWMPTLIYWTRGVGTNNSTSIGNFGAKRCIFFHFSSVPEKVAPAQMTSVSVDQQIFSNY